MKILIESTDYFVKIGGVECRIWNGVTENETQVFVAVHRVIVSDEDDKTELVELLEQPPTAVQVLKVEK